MSRSTEHHQGSQHPSRRRLGTRVPTPGARPVLTALTVLTVLLGAGWPLAAQEPLPGFAEVLDVRVVNLEVVVTDRDGRRVTGLQQDDFELVVDGEVRPIEFFSEVRDGVVEGGDGGGPGIDGVVSGEPLPTNYLVFVDDFFSVSQDRDRVLERLRAQLTGLRPSDRVAVVAFDGNRLEALSRWSSDTGEIAAALSAAARRPTQGLQRLAERRTADTQRREYADLQLLTIERIQATGGTPPDRPFARVGLDPEERSYAYRLTAQLERSVLAATSAMRSFAGARGRKVMLMLVGGWPFDPAEFVVGDYSPVVEEAAAGELQTFFSVDLLSPLVDSANLAGFTLYPVDVPGQDTDLGADASESTGEFERFAPGASLGGTGTPREQQVHATLDYLADRTGGVALLNAERDDALERAIADTRTYYWLGFSPQREADDGRHEVEVRVRGRDDLRVRNRDGFVDLSRQSEVAMIVESALLFGDPPSTRPLRLRFGRPNKSFRRLRVPLEVGIDMRDVTLVPTSEGYQGRLSVRVAAMTEGGERSSTTRDVIEIRGDAPPKPGQLWFYETVLTLRPRPHRIVVAVYDTLGGVLLSASGEIDG